MCVHVSTRCTCHTFFHSLPTIMSFRAFVTFFSEQVCDTAADEAISFGAQSNKKLEYRVLLATYYYHVICCTLLACHNII